MSYIEETDYGYRLIIDNEHCPAIQDYILNGNHIVQFGPKAQDWCDRLGYDPHVRRADYSLGASTDPNHRRCWYYYMYFTTERDALLFKTWFT